MAQNETFTPAQRKKFLIVFGVIVAVGIIVFWVAMGKIVGDIGKRNEMTAALPENVTKLFNCKYHDLQPSVAEEFVGRVPFERYIFFSNHSVTLGDSLAFTHAYDPSINEKLGTDIYYGSEELDGIVFEKQGAETVGYYGNTTTKRAIQSYKVIYYMTYPELVIIRQDTLWGGTPPSTIESHASAGVGKGVKDKDLVAAIKAAMGV